MVFKNYSYSSFLNLTFSHFKLLFSNFLFQYFVIQYASTQFTGISIQNSLCYSPLQNACQRGSILGDAIPPGYLSLTFIDCLKSFGNKFDRRSYMYSTVTHIKKSGMSGIFLLYLPTMVSLWHLLSSRRAWQRWPNASSASKGGSLRWCRHGNLS